MRGRRPKGAKDRTLLLDSPPPAGYAGFTPVTISDGAPTPTLDSGTDYLVTMTSPMTKTAYLIGGRNVVLIGGEVNLAPTITTTTTTASMTSGVTTITLASNTGMGTNDYIVVDPGDAAKAESMQLTSFVSGTTWNVARNTGQAGSGDNGGGLAVSHLSAAPVERQIDLDARKGLFLKNWTGTMHVEGLRIRGNRLAQGVYIHQQVTGTTLQMQDLRIEDVNSGDNRNFHDAHPDVIQIAEGPETVRVDRLTGSTQMFGFQWQPYNLGFNRARVWDLRNVNLFPSADGSRYMWYTNFYSGGPLHAARIRSTEVYLDPDPDRLSWAYLRYGDVNNPTEPMLPHTVGVPPGGDFVPAAKVGAGYVSPGYNAAPSAAPPVSALYRQRVLQASPWAYWRMRETSGTVATNASFWSPGDATISGAVLNSVDSPLANDPGKAFGFNGTTSYVSTSIDLGWDKITLAFYMWVDSYSGSTRRAVEFTANGDTSTGGFSLSPDAFSSGAFDIYMHDPSAGDSGAAFPRPSAAAWHHIVVELDRTVISSAGAARLWTDGVEQTPTAIYDEAVQGGIFAVDTLYIGSRGGTTKFFSGRLAEFAVFGYLLDPADIADLVAP